MEKTEKMRISYNYLETLRDTYKVCMSIANSENAPKDIRDMARREAEDIRLSGEKEKREIRNLKEEI